MSERKLSFLQKEYRQFFLERLAQFGVNSPARLSKEEKSEFFTGIKQGWKIKKLEFAKRTRPKAKPTKKQGYAKLIVSRPAVALEPKNFYNSKGSTIDHPEEDKEMVEKVLSEKNPDQSDDLRINFNPNQFFEQEEPYSYPVVKMPKEGSYLKLPRKGRALGKGFKEDDFHRAIIAHIPEMDVVVDVHLAIPYYNKPYEPDIVLVDKDLNLYIDIEIDEPYDGYYRFPRHESGKDETRDLFFIESGWVVIRFTERQVHLQEAECITYIRDVLDSIYTYRLEQHSECLPERQWDYQQSVRWEKAHYREKYLGIESFGKQKVIKELVVEIDDVDEIENNLNRTRKHQAQSLLENIAFEDETHKYHHPKDETGNAEYISVTTLIDRFFPFDLDRYITGKARKEGRTEEDVLEEFLKNRDEAAEKGTHLHEQIENFLKGEAYESDFKEFDMFKEFYKDIVVSRGFIFVEAEKKILLERYNIAGTVDALFKKPDSEEYMIVDWKRSKKLVIDGYPKKYGYGYGLSELSHLDNSSYYKYALQQNIYRNILQNNYGLSISSMNLIVLHENFEKYHRVNLEVLESEVEVIFKSINHKI
ncbi:hypothetical protein [Algoriphagus sediminis]|uniref:PD-(D/E)XK endonuclease-like domain-containing protein n=1 Tax=Algoriphagus sediminis TaxID=3057113 RepID=A0ABT7YGJ7_9BACT|nr:hypothetical protein [Algoriphagus sediminis]MDN3205651.1 hypothetical protein [Algoriphagus sediminis]